MESAVPGTRPRSALVQKLSLRRRDQRSGVRVRGALPLFPLINVAFTRSDIKVPNPCSPSTPCLWLFLYGGHVDSVAQASRSNARMARRHQVVVVLDRRRGGYHPRRRDAGDCGCRSRAANRGGLSDASEFLASRLVDVILPLAPRDPSCKTQSRVARIGPSPFRPPLESGRVTLGLVARFSQIEGYKCFTLTRALDVVKCQLALV